MTGRRKATSDLWWKNAVIYCLDIQTFLDSDGDGCGDLVGLTERIDYLEGLGVTRLWLMPCCESPGRDDGYDIVDFYALDPRLGTFGDFVEMVRTAQDRGIRVIADLVVNHTSHNHPWFQSARKGVGANAGFHHAPHRNPGLCREQPEVGQTRGTRRDRGLSVRTSDDRPQSSLPPLRTTV